MQGNDDLGKLEDSTRKYYEDFSTGYLEFYDSWFRVEGAFSNPDYKEGYDKVAETLTNVVGPEQVILDVGCGWERGQHCWLEAAPT